VREEPEVVIIGAGLAGSEAVWQCARRGVRVRLCEQRPVTTTPVHRTGLFAELVCSNSFKSTDSKRCAGLLKNELRSLDSLLMECADVAQIPGGAALVVDRDAFSGAVTERLESHPLVSIRRETVCDASQLVESDVPVVIAVGPCASTEFWASLGAIAGGTNLYFFDATSPIIAADSIDKSIVFEGARYGKGGNEGYLNAPMNEREFIRFCDALLSGDVTPLSHGESLRLFEGCLPIEELARRGAGALRFGAMKPVGLRDPRTDARPYAVVQLRQENAIRDAYSLVGFQTRLTYPAQEAAIRLIPGLEKARFIRHGRMHRNSYVESPKLLAPTLRLRDHPHILLAGQITGLEGYQAAILTGLVAGINATLLAMGLESLVPPRHTVIGEAIRWLTDETNTDFRPTAPVFGMWKDVPAMRKSERTAWYQRESAMGIGKYAEIVSRDCK
jgi:methylenetetrahydrofolate--tRNA-(uracil-5-)-methyltransferase